MRTSFLRGVLLGLVAVLLASGAVIVIDNHTAAGAIVGRVGEFRSNLVLGLQGSFATLKPFTMRSATGDQVNLGVYVSDGPREQGFHWLTGCGLFTKNGSGLADTYLFATGKVQFATSVDPSVVYAVNGGAPQGTYHTDLAFEPVTISPPETLFSCFIFGNNPHLGFQNVQALQSFGDGQAGIEGRILGTGTANFQLLYSDREYSRIDTTGGPSAPASFLGSTPNYPGTNHASDALVRSNGTTICAMLAANNCPNP